MPTSNRDLNDKNLMKSLHRPVLSQESLDKLMRFGVNEKQETEWRKAMKVVNFMLKAIKYVAVNVALAVAGIVFGMSMVVAYGLTFGH